MSLLHRTEPPVPPPPAPLIPAGTVAECDARISALIDRRLALEAGGAL